MSRNPYGTDEPDRDDPGLDRVADELERYAAAERREPPLDLAGRIHAAVDAEPDPRRGWLRSLTAVLPAWRAPARALAVGAVLLVAVVGALAVGELVERARQADVGASPTPPVVVSPSPSPSASPTPSPSPSPTPSPIPSATPTPVPRTPEPSATGSDEAETPEPSESDNSGPGGGGGDNSGPGGGG